MAKKKQAKETPAVVNAPAQTIALEIGDAVLWNWAGGTSAIIVGFVGIRAEIMYIKEKQKHRALVFASSLKFVSREIKATKKTPKTKTPAKPRTKKAA